MLCVSFDEEIPEVSENVVNAITGQRVRLNVSQIHTYYIICGPVDTVKKLWPYASQTTSECGLSDLISSDLYLDLYTCDRITQGGHLYQGLIVSALEMTVYYIYIF